jgi:acyl dehydratase
MAGGGLFWEELEPGRRWTSEERLVSAADVATFAAVSGDLNPLHLSDAHARSAGFAGAIAHGVLGLAVATGLVNRLGLTAGTLVALLGVSWRFTEPLYPGTSVAVGVMVGPRRATRRADRGVVEMHVELRDAAGTVYQRGELTMLVRRQVAVASAVS